MKIKQQRAQEQIRMILSDLLLREIRDPKLRMVTVTEVICDSELMFAKVYVNAMGDESRRKQVMKGLERAKGFMRREVARKVRLRTAPDLHFHWDETLEQGEKIHRLLADLEIPSEENDLDDPEETGMD